MTPAKSTMISNIHYYRYPQYRWSQDIIKVLESGLINDVDQRLILDAPCGDGIISYWLNKRPQQNLMLCDLDDSLINTARNHIRNATIKNESIFDINIEGENNIWLLVNSLYCLPDKQALLHHMAPKVEYIIAVFPYTDHKNYQVFLKQNPQFKNLNAMSQSETLNFFKTHGFKNILLKDTTFISHYNFKRRLRFAGLTKRLLNVFDPLLNHRKGSYWLAVFVKNTHPSKPEHSF